MKTQILFLAACLAALVGTAGARAGTISVDWDRPSDTDVLGAARRHSRDWDVREPRHAPYGGGIQIVRRTIYCASVDLRDRECGTGLLSIISASAQQISDMPCTEGVTWGYRGNAVWVKKGCRAQIAVVGTAFGVPQDPGNPDPGPGSPGLVTRSLYCESRNLNEAQCDSGMIAIVSVSAQQISSASCIEGDSWMRRGTKIVVKKGCRAQFTVTGIPTPW